ncbi:MFS general substrate transporter [Xylariaceae sp. FL0255]|nr:MFS general substrate transporter [Xylariaceae sp. FL0255]
MALQSISERAGRDDISEITITEQTPLVRKSPTLETDAIPTDQPGIFSSLPPFPTAIRRPQNPDLLVGILTLVIFIASASGGFLNIPMIRVFEDILCRQYYDKIRNREDGAPIDEGMCKVDAIQSELAYLFAVMAALNAGLSCLSALPWGIAADRIGRRQIYAIGVTGMALSIIWIMGIGWFNVIFPPRLIWISPVFYLLGGGNPVISAVVQGMTVDIVPESQRAISLLRISAGSMIGNLVSPALASLLMTESGPWPPMGLAFFLIMVTVPLIFIIPETSKEDTDNDSDDIASTGFKHRLAQSLRELKRSATIFRSPSMVILLLMCMLELPVILSTYMFLSQFASKRYDILLKDTGYIQTAYGIAVCIACFIVLPLLSSFVMKPEAPSFLRMSDDRRRDLIFLQWSFIAMMAGTFILGISLSLAGFIIGLMVLAFGNGASSYIKSLATLYVSSDQRSRLFTILGLAMIGSDLWASPSLAALFSLGMRLGGRWIGLPYFGLFVLCVIMLILSLLMRLPKVPGDGGNESHDED